MSPGHRDEGCRLHDDSEREALHTRVTVGAAEAIRAFAKERDVTLSSLFDAMLHTLDDADPAWLGGLVDQARAFDARSRSKKPPKKVARGRNSSGGPGRAR